MMARFILALIVSMVPVTVHDSVIHTCTSASCTRSDSEYPRYSYSTTSRTFKLVISSAEVDDDKWTCAHIATSERETIVLGLGEDNTVSLVLLILELLLAATSLTGSCVQSCAVEKKINCFEVTVNDESAKRISHGAAVVIALLSIIAIIIGGIGYNDTSEKGRVLVYVSLSLACVSVILIVILIKIFRNKN